MKKNNRHYYEKRLILISLTCYGAFIYVLFNGLIPALIPLIPIRGTIECSNIQISDTENQGIKNKKVRFTFRLNEYDKEFYSLKIVEKNRDEQELSRITNQLNESNFVTVWVKKHNKNKRNPLIYQLDIDGITQMKTHEDISSNIPVLVLMFLLGTSSILSVLKKRYPDKIRIFSKNM